MSNKTVTMKATIRPNLATEVRKLAKWFDLPVNQTVNHLVLTALKSPEGKKHPGNQDWDVVIVERAK